MAHRRDLASLDSQIESLMAREKLPEAEVKALCDKVRAARATATETATVAAAAAAPLLVTPYYLAHTLILPARLSAPPALGN